MLILDEILIINIVCFHFNWSKLVHVKQSFFEWLTRMTKKNRFFPVLIYMNLIIRNRKIARRYLLVNLLLMYSYTVSVFFPCDTLIWKKRWYTTTVGTIILNDMVILNYLMHSWTNIIHVYPHMHERWIIYVFHVVWR